MAKNNTDEFKTKKDKNESRQERRRFKEFRDLVTKDEFYISLRKNWREYEQHNQ